MQILYINGAYLVSETCEPDTPTKIIVNSGETQQRWQELENRRAAGDPEIIVAAQNSTEQKEALRQGIKAVVSLFTSSGVISVPLENREPICLDASFTSIIYLQSLLNVATADNMNSVSVITADNEKTDISLPDLSACILAVQRYLLYANLQGFEEKQKRVEDIEDLTYKISTQYSGLRGIKTDRLLQTMGIPPLQEGATPRGLFTNRNNEKLNYINPLALYGE